MVKIKTNDALLVTISTQNSKMFLDNLPNETIILSFFFFVL